MVLEIINNFIIYELRNIIIISENLFFLSIILLLNCCLYIKN